MKLAHFLGCATLTSGMRQKWNLDRPGVISGLLVLAAFAIYLPIIFLGFVNYDDPLYVTDNSLVRRGLTWDGINWGFTHSYSANWHPITWLSHMLDVQAYGLAPLGHHVTNVLFHAANTVLLFLWLRTLTGACGRSAVVAALFALHPLHVESVAWIAERKDLLSAFFGILTLWAYSRYARESKKSFYWIAVFLFALGLMSKPMLVTWPFVMLLLDFWPLGRGAVSARSNAVTTRSWLRRWLTLVVEKIPFFLMTLIASFVTFSTQKAEHAVVSLQTVSLEQRFINIPVAYIRYLGKTFWPVDLSVLYPLTTFSWLAAGAALVGLLAITLLALQQAKARPYLITGWLWFLGTLVPVIGLVQVGNQSLADRYTYLPSIGLFIMLVWLVADIAEGSAVRRGLVIFVTVAALAACALVTGRQLLYWQNSETLFRRTLATTTNNSVAWVNLGSALGAYREHREALACYQRAVKITPNYAEAWFDIGCALGELNRVDEAIAAYKIALNLNPNHRRLRNNLGAALAAKGLLEEAEINLRAAVALEPTAADVRNNMGNLLARQGQWPAAIAEFKQALALEATMTEARVGLAGALAKAGNYDEAVSELSGLLKQDPGNTAARLQLAGTLAMRGQPDLAVREYSRLIEANPNDAVAHSRLASLLMRTGHPGDAIKQYRAALAANAAFTDALNNLAWTLSTHPQAQYRNGEEAVSLAERACALTSYQQSFMVGTLAAAYAEAGRFSDAVSAAEKAQALAVKENDGELAAKNAQLIELYRAGKPYRESEP